MFKKTLQQWLETNKYNMVEGAKRLGIGYSTLYGYLYYGQKPSKKRKKMILDCFSKDNVWSESEAEVDYKKTKGYYKLSGKVGFEVEETFTISQIKEAIKKASSGYVGDLMKIDVFMESIGYKRDWVKK